MPSAPEAAIYPGPEAMPAAARALFGFNLGDSLPWYRATLAAALPAGAKPVFLVAGDPPAAILPMLLGQRGATSLTTPYSWLWGPLGQPAAADLEQAGRALGAWCRRFAVVRLDALDLGDARWQPILAGLRAAGLLVQSFDHFGNWQTDLTGVDWAGYLAARPGALRSTLRRQASRQQAAGASFDLVRREGDGLQAAIAAYEAVYAHSWKQPEPFPAFIPTLIRATAQDGSLRLGLLRQGGAVHAAQFWVVRAGTATVLKLAHDEAHKAASPGTVLTGMMIRHMMEQDGIARLDFGRGDDAYKRDWTDSRQQRSGMLLINRWRLRGMAELLRGAARSAWKGRPAPEA